MLFFLPFLQWSFLFLINDFLQSFKGNFISYLTFYCTSLSFLLYLNLINTQDNILHFRPKKTQDQNCPEFIKIHGANSFPSTKWQTKLVRRAKATDWITETSFNSNPFALSISLKLSLFIQTQLTYSLFDTFELSLQ